MGYSQVHLLVAFLGVLQCELYQSAPIQFSSTPAHLRFPLCYTYGFPMYNWQIPYSSLNGKCPQNAVIISIPTFTNSGRTNIIIDTRKLPNDVLHCHNKTQTNGKPDVNLNVKSINDNCDNRDSTKDTSATPEKSANNNKDQNFIDFSSTNNKAEVTIKALSNKHSNNKVASHDNTAAPVTDDNTATKYHDAPPTRSNFAVTSDEIRSSQNDDNVVTSETSDKFMASAALSGIDKGNHNSTVETSDSATTINSGSFSTGNNYNVDKDFNSDSESILSSSHKDDNHDVTKLGGRGNNDSAIHNLSNEGKSGLGNGDKDGAANVGSVNLSGDSHDVTTTSKNVSTDANLGSTTTNRDDVSILSSKRDGKLELNNDETMSAKSESRTSKDNTVILKNFGDTTARTTMSETANVAEVKSSFGVLSNDGVTDTRFDDTAVKSSSDNSKPDLSKNNVTVLKTESKINKNTSSSINSDKTSTAFHIDKAKSSNDHDKSELKYENGTEVKSTSKISENDRKNAEYGSAVAGNYQAAIKEQKTNETNRHSNKSITTNEHEADPNKNAFAEAKPGFEASNKIDGASTYLVSKNAENNDIVVKGSRNDHKSGLSNGDITEAISKSGSSKDVTTSSNSGNRSININDHIVKSSTDSIISVLNDNDAVEAKSKPSNDDSAIVNSDDSSDTSSYNVNLDQHRFQNTRRYITSPQTTTEEDSNSNKYTVAEAKLNHTDLAINGLSQSGSSHNSKDAVITQSASRVTSGYADVIPAGHKISSTSSYNTSFITNNNDDSAIVNSDSSDTGSYNLNHDQHKFQNTRRYSTSPVTTAEEESNSNKYTVAEAKLNHSDDAINGFSQSGSSNNSKDGVINQSASRVTSDYADVIPAGHKTFSTSSYNTSLITTSKHDSDSIKPTSGAIIKNDTIGIPADFNHFIVQSSNHDRKSGLSNSSDGETSNDDLVNEGSGRGNTNLDDDAVKRLVNGGAVFESKALGNKDTTASVVSTATVESTKIIKNHVGADTSDKDSSVRRASTGVPTIGHDSIEGTD